MYRLTTLLVVFFATTARGADVSRIPQGPHSLVATFEGKDARWNFFHDVQVHSTAEKMKLVVVKDLASEADKSDKKRAQGGFGDPSDDGTVRWPARPAGQIQWLSPKRQIHGTVDDSGVIRFGVTTTVDGRLVSLHFVGRCSFSGSSGDVFLLTSKEPARKGTWKLENPFSQAGLVPGFNGAQNPLGR